MLNIFNSRKGNKGPLWALYSHVLDGRVLKRPDGTRGVVVSGLHHDILGQRRASTAYAQVRLVRWQGSSKACAVREEHVQAWLTDAFANETWVPESIRVAQLNKWASPTKQELPLLKAQLKTTSPQQQKAQTPVRCAGGRPSAANKRTVKSLTPPIPPTTMSDAPAPAATADSPVANAANAEDLHSPSRLAWSHMRKLVHSCTRALVIRMAAAGEHAAGVPDVPPLVAGANVTPAQSSRDSGTVLAAVKPKALGAVEARVLVAFDHSSLQQILQRQQA